MRKSTSTSLVGRDIRPSSAAGAAPSAVDGSGKHRDRRFQVELLVSVPFRFAGLFPRRPPAGINPGGTVLARRDRPAVAVGRTIYKIAVRPAPARVAQTPLLIGVARPGRRRPIALTPAHLAPMPSQQRRATAAQQQRMLAQAGSDQVEVATAAAPFVDGAGRQQRMSGCRAQRMQQRPCRQAA